MICSPCLLRIIRRCNQGGWTIRACDEEEKNKLQRDLEGEVKGQRDHLKALGVGENLIFKGILKKQVGWLSLDSSDSGYGEVTE